MTWSWVNNGRNVILQWTVPLKLSSVLFPWCSAELLSKHFLCRVFSEIDFDALLWKDHGNVESADFSPTRARVSAGYSLALIPINIANGESKHDECLKELRLLTLPQSNETWLWQWHGRQTSPQINRRRAERYNTKHFRSKVWTRTIFRRSLFCSLVWLKSTVKPVKLFSYWMQKHFIPVVLKLNFQRHLFSQCHNSSEILLIWQFAVINNLKHFSCFIVFWKLIYFYFK